MMNHASEMRADSLVSGLCFQLTQETCCPSEAFLLPAGKGGDEKQYCQGHLYYWFISGKSEILQRS